MLSSMRTFGDDSVAVSSLSDSYDAVSNIRIISRMDFFYGIGTICIK